MLRSTASLALFCGLIGLSPSVFADGSQGQRVNICHGYSCIAQVEIHFSPGQLGEIRRLLFSAVDQASEREMLADAMGRLYRWAGEQSDIRNDRGGNYADGHMPGKMDCIDHSTSTTRLLELLAGHAYLRWHRVDVPQARHFLGLIASHWSAVIEEIDSEPPQRFVVDSWFVNNGEPAVILPLEAWKKGAGPDV